VAVQRRPDVVRPQRGRDPDRRRLVAAPGVEGAWNLALFVEDVAALLDPSRDQHVPVDAEQVLAVEPRLPDLTQRAERLCFTDRHRRGIVTIAPEYSEGVGKAADWLREERRKTLGDWVAFCLGCGLVQRYFEEFEDELPSSCPQCSGEMRARCPDCG